VGACAVEVRTAIEMDHCDGLVLPGGESSTMLKLLAQEGLFEPLRRFGRSRPIYGSCAGAILLARTVASPTQKSLNLLNISVERNAYGRQIDSRIARIPTAEHGEIEAVFIRAPIIRRVGDEVGIIAMYQGDPVWAEQGPHMVTTFHPELTSDPCVHRRFMDKL
jgi:5'-phosphate synthase pdxT subunit